MSFIPGMSIQSEVGNQPFCGTGEAGFDCYHTLTDGHMTYGFPVDGSDPWVPS